MKPIRIGTPYTVTDHGKPVTRCYVWFPDGTREMMNEARLAWTLEYGKPPKGWVVRMVNGKPACMRRGVMARRTRRTMGRKVREYTERKPYPLAA